MKIVCTTLLILVLIGLSSCASATPVPTAAVEVLDTPTSSANSDLPVLKTTMGDFVIVATHLVDEVHDEKAPAGEKILLVSLAGPDLEKLVAGEFSLETFSTMVADGGDEIYIMGSNGSQTFSSGMGGWVEEEFVFGFRVPIEDRYTLYWPGNAPIELQTGP